MEEKKITPDLDWDALKKIIEEHQANKEKEICPHCKRPYREDWPSYPYWRVYPYPHYGYPWITPSYPIPIYMTTYTTDTWEVK